MSKAPPQADALSFVVRDRVNGGFDYWAATSTGHYGADFDAGNALGVEFLNFLADHPTVGHGTLLGCIVGSMIDKGDATGKGLRIGFLGAVNKAAMGGALFMQAVTSRAA